VQVCLDVLQGMRAEFDRVLAQAVQVFGPAHPHQAFLFASARSCPSRPRTIIHEYPRMS
jgi:hypothetical protein